MNKNLESTTNNSYKKLDVQTEVTKKNPPFYNTVNWLFNKATRGKYSIKGKDLTEEELVMQINGAKKSAAKWGGICTTVVTEGGYALAEKIAPYNFGHIDSEWKILGLTALAGSILYYSDNFKEWNKKFPVYMNGMKFATAAYSITTIADIIIRHL
jgi:hypothetical protein